jgi:hypothetical protein
MGAKTASQTVAKVENKQEVMGPVTVTPARLVDEGMTTGAIAGLPDEFKGAETLAGFPPSAKFDRVGDCIFGEFVGMRESVGPNASRLYELSVPGTNNGEAMSVAVWGSAALDRLYDSAYPPIQSGDRLAFIFLGEKATKRGLNPVRLFALKVKRPGQATKTTRAA